MYIYYGMLHWLFFTTRIMYNTGQGKLVFPTSWLGPGLLLLEFYVQAFFLLLFHTLV